MLPEVEERVCVLGQVCGINRLNRLLQCARLHQTIWGIAEHSLIKRSANEIKRSLLCVQQMAVVRTVDEQDQNAFLDWVVCVWDVAFHLISELLIFTANLDQLSGNTPQSRLCNQGWGWKEAEQKQHSSKHICGNTCWLRCQKFPGYYPLQMHWVESSHLPQSLLAGKGALEKQTAAYLKQKLFFKISCSCFAWLSHIFNLYTKKA